MEVLLGPNANKYQVRRRKIRRTSGY